MKIETLIKSHLEELCRVTRVDVTLLTFLIQHKVISQEFYENIETSTSDVKKALLLYNYFMTRPIEDLQVILEGLEKSLNKRAVEILNKAKSEDEPGTSTNLKTKPLAAEDDVSSVLNNFTDLQFSLKWPISHGIKLPVNNFAGREDEIKQLESFYENNKKLVLVCGFGGLGKTELVRKYMNNLVKQDVTRVWLHGDTFESLKSSVFSFASKLGVKNNKASSPQMLEYLIEMTLRHCNKIAIVIDNVDTIFEEVRAVMQMIKVFEDIFVIVTSRDRVVLDNAGVRMELGILSKKDSRNILLNSVDNLSDSDADLLCKLVQYYPLALQQAIAYVKVQREHFLTPSYNVFDYVNEFNQQKAKMLAQKLNQYEHDYSETTLFTWDITFDKLSEDAIQFLKILAFLEPDSISVDFFEEVCREFGHNKVQIENIVNKLKKYSLIKVENSIISIHRLVQDVMRGRVENVFSKKMYDVIGNIYIKRRYRKLGDKVVDLVDDTGGSHMSRITQLAYGVKFKRYWIYDPTHVESKNPNPVLIYFKSNVALDLCEESKYSESLQLCEQVLCSDSSEYGWTLENIFRSLLRISKNYSTSVVVKLLENLLESKKSTFGNVHVTKIKIVLASILEIGERQLELVQEIRNHYDLLKHDKRGMEKFYAKLFLPIIRGSQHWVTRDHIYWYADSCDPWQLEFEVLVKLLPLYEEVLDENDKLTLQVKNAMAMHLYHKSKEFDKSLELLEQVISSNVGFEVDRAYGTMDDIAKHFYRNRNYNEAKVLFERTLSFFKANGVEKEHEVSDTMNYLAKTLFKLDCDLEYARDLYREVLSYYEEGKGKDKYHEYVLKQKIEKIKSVLRMSE